MDLVNILIIVSSVVLILLLWGVVGVRHFRYLDKSIKKQWEMVEDGLKKRHDLLPNFVETVRKYSDKQEGLMEELIKSRSLAAREHTPTAKNIEYEHDLSKVIRRVIDLARMLKEVSQDTNFLELRKELLDVGKRIEESSRQYNKMVRYYNKHRRLFYLIPLAAIFGFKSINIFEIEL